MTDEKLITTAERTSRDSRITSAIISFSLAVMGLGKADYKTLEGVTLQQMIEAVAWTKLLNGLERDRVKAAGGGTMRLSMYPDDRLIAAVYTLIHYKREKWEEDDVPCIITDDEKHTHFLVVGVRTATLSELETVEKDKTAVKWSGDKKRNEAQ